MLEGDHGMWSRRERMWEMNKGASSDEDSALLCYSSRDLSDEEQRRKSNDNSLRNRLAQRK